MWVSQVPSANLWPLELLHKLALIYCTSFSTSHPSLSSASLFPLWIISFFPLRKSFKELKNVWKMIEPKFRNWALALHVSVSDQILSIQPQYLRHGEVENPWMCTTAHSATSKSKKVIVPCNIISRGLDTFRLVWLVLPCVQTNTRMREEGFCLSDQPPLQPFVKL